MKSLFQLLNMTITDISTFFYSRNDIDLKDIITTEQLIEEAIVLTHSHSSVACMPVHL